MIKMLIRMTAFVDADMPCHAAMRSSPPLARRHDFRRVYAPRASVTPRCCHAIRRCYFATMLL